MPPPPTRLSEESVHAIEAAQGALMTAASQHLDARLDWYRALPAQERSWVGLIAQSGITTFVGWCRDNARRRSPSARLTADVFGAAPRELTRSITLAQTVDLVRTIVEVVEDHVVDLAAPGDEVALSLAVLRYSREVAFATAQVYANAAEARGAWDARLESLVVDAVLRGEADDEMMSRATALGWGELGPVTVVVGYRQAAMATDSAVERIRIAAARVGLECLIAVQGRRLVIILGGGPTDGVNAGVSAVLPYLADGPVVVGPSVPRLFAAGRSARAALSGLRAAPAWPQAPRPVAADELLPERVLLGDLPARNQLVERVYQPLRRAGGALLETATEFLHGGRGIEATARALYVHANTVRYRLGRIAEVTGYDLTVPREAHVVDTALALGALGPRTRRAET